MSSNNPSENFKKITIYFYLKINYIYIRFIYILYWISSLNNFPPLIKRVVEKFTIFFSKLYELSINKMLSKKIANLKFSIFTIKSLNVCKFCNSKIAKF